MQVGVVGWVFLFLKRQGVAEAATPMDPQILPCTE